MNRNRKSDYNMSSENPDEEPTQRYRSATDGAYDATINKHEDDEISGYPQNVADDDYTEDDILNKRMGFIMRTRRRFGF